VRINPPCRQLALRVLERMGLSLYSFKIGSYRVSGW